MLAGLGGCPTPPPDSAPVDTGSPVCTLVLEDPDAYGTPRWVLAHDDAAGTPDRIEMTVAWYGGLITLEAQLAPDLDEGTLPWLPHRVAEHDLQQAWEAQGHSLSVQVRLEARWPDGRGCVVETPLPFRDWDQPDTVRLATGMHFVHDELTAERSEQLSDHLGLLVLSDGELDGDYAHQVYLMAPPTGDVLQRFVLDRSLMESTAIGAFTGGELASAGVSGGELTVMTECAVGVSETQLYRYQLASGELLHAYDASEYAERAGPLCAHNRMFVDPSRSDRLHTILWQYRSPDDPPGTDQKSVAARLRLSDDLSVERFDSWVDGAEVTTNEELYGNSIALSPPGEDGSSFATVTFPATFGGEVAPEDASGFVAAGPVDGHTPHWIFVREGFLDGLADTLDQDLPDATVVEVPDTEGAPTMDFLHGAELVARGDTQLELWILSLGRAEPTRLHRFELDSDAGTLTPRCRFEPQRDPSSYSNLLMLRGEGLVGLFLGGVAELEWLDADSCTRIGTQVLEDESPATRTKPRWLESVDAGQLADGERVLKLELRYDLSLGLELYGDL